MRRAAAPLRIARSGGPFVEDGVESAGLPPGVRVRWFRSTLARPLLDAPPAGPVPPGAVVWAAEPALGVDDYPGASAVVPAPPGGEGPRALPEPEAAPAVVPGVREAVEAALDALPRALRAGAAAEVEVALAAVGL